jgi:transglutaminase superfamily protein
MPSGRLGSALFACRVVALAACVPALMRLRLGRLAALLEPRTMPPPPGDEQLRALARRVDGLLLRGRPLVRPGCLTRGVTLYWFLRRAGADVRLVFGMGHVDGAPAGHCWLVHDGRPFLEKVDPRPLFAELYRIPQRAD